MVWKDWTPIVDRIRCENRRHLLFLSRSEISLWFICGVKSIDTVDCHTHPTVSRGQIGHYCFHTSRYLACWMPSVSCLIWLFYVMYSFLRSTLGENHHYCVWLLPYTAVFSLDFDNVRFLLLADDKPYWWWSNSTRTSIAVRGNCIQTDWAAKAWE